jgi:hypothetical protein
MSCDNDTPVDELAKVTKYDISYRTYGDTIRIMQFDKHTAYQVENGTTFYTSEDDREPETMITTFVCDKGYVFIDTHRSDLGHSYEVLVHVNDNVYMSYPCDWESFLEYHGTMNNCIIGTHPKYYTMYAHLIGKGHKVEPTEVTWVAPEYLNDKSYTTPYVESDFFHDVNPKNWIVE